MDFPHSIRTSSLSDGDQYSKSPGLGTKSPKLPGAEKFRFADHSPSRLTPPPAGTPRSKDNDESGPASFLRGASSRRTCPPTFGPGSSSPSNGNGSSRFSRSDTKRKPVLPISCQKTCRMLTLTNRPLSVDCIDARAEEPPVVSRQRTSVGPIDIVPQGHPSVDDDKPSHKRISLPINVEAHLGHGGPTHARLRATLNDSNEDFISSQHSPDLRTSQANPEPICTGRFLNNNYKSLDMHRFSTSSCGSSVSEEDIWLPRKTTM